MKNLEKYTKSISDRNLETLYHTNYFNKSEFLFFIVVIPEMRYKFDLYSIISKMRYRGETTIRPINISYDGPYKLRKIFE